MIKGWKTLLFSAGVAVFGVLQTFDVASVLPAQWVGPVIAGIGIVGAILRTITTTPVGKK